MQEWRELWEQRDKHDKLQNELVQNAIRSLGSARERQKTEAEKCAAAALKHARQCTDKKCEGQLPAHQ